MIFKMFQQFIRFNHHIFKGFCMQISLLFVAF